MKYFQTNTAISIREAHLSYIPKPISIENVVLPEYLEPLIETLAEHNHDLWGQERIRSGWTYGPQRDDIKKTNPDLVAYHDLPEGEKDYDRNSAVGILKAIVALGYRIEKPEPKRH
jgi:hypothetical protein